jgi:hypothetical protein
VQLFADEQAIVLREVEFASDLLKVGAQAELKPGIVIEPQADLLEGIDMPPAAEEGLEDQLSEEVPGFVDFRRVKQKSKHAVARLAQGGHILHRREHIEVQIAGCEFIRQCDLGQKLIVHETPAAGQSPIRMKFIYGSLVDFIGIIAGIVVVETEKSEIEQAEFPVLIDVLLPDKIEFDGIMAGEQLNRDLCMCTAAGEQPQEQEQTASFPDQAIIVKRRTMPHRHKGYRNGRKLEKNAAIASGVVR